MKITLVRHGEVAEEYLGKYNGHIDIELSENGLKQARELGKELQETHFEKIYCSDLLRAKQTLKEFDLKQEVFYAQELREKHWGRHEGKSFEDISQEGVVYENFEQWISALDGESIFDFQNRVKEYFNEVILKQTTKSVLVVTHSGVIKTLLCLVNNISLEEAFTKTIPYASKIDIEINAL